MAPVELQCGFRREKKHNLFFGCDVVSWWKKRWVLHLRLSFVVLFVRFEWNSRRKFRKVFYWKADDVGDGMFVHCDVCVGFVCWRQLFAKSNIEFLFQQALILSANVHKLVILSTLWVSWNAHKMAKWRLSIVIYVSMDDNFVAFTLPLPFNLLLGVKLRLSLFRMIFAFGAYNVQFHEDVIQHFYFRILLTRLDVVLMIFYTMLSFLLVSVHTFCEWAYMFGWHSFFHLKSYDGTWDDEAQKIPKQKLCKSRECIINNDP